MGIGSSSVFPYSQKRNSHGNRNENVAKKYEIMFYVFAMDLKFNSHVHNLSGIKQHTMHVRAATIYEEIYTMFLLAS